MSGSIHLQGNSTSGFFSLTYNQQREKLNGAILLREALSLLYIVSKTDPL